MHTAAGAREVAERGIVEMIVVNVTVCVRFV